jgi:hypothetical protein
MAEAKGINPQITTEEIMLTPEVKEEVKEAPSKLRQPIGSRMGGCKRPLERRRI